MRRTFNRESRMPVSL